MSWWLYQGDCVEVMRTWPEASIDAVVCDPPYGLEFMGKAWDSGVEQEWHETWAREALRLLKPGGHMLAFGGTRTYHRMTCAIEDAGFEIRDSLHWFYGTGFPKSLNVGQGRGTALKPGHEPIVLARRALEGTVAANVAKWGTGALNIDATRLNVGELVSGGGANFDAWRAGQERTDRPAAHKRRQSGHSNGRWPANVLLDEDAAAELDEQSGVLKSGAVRASDRVYTYGEQPVYNKRSNNGRVFKDDIVGSTGGASRFFYVAKPTRKERDLGCEGAPVRSGGQATDREDGSDGLNSPRAGAGRRGGVKNHHPTVKPVELMRYLVRLVTPPAGVVLDPFVGSGTTGMAARLEGVRFVGIEREPEYATIAWHRINAAVQPQQEQAHG